MPKNAQVKSVSRETLQVEPRVGIFAVGSVEAYARMKAVHFAFYTVLKRIIDFFLAAVLLVALAPLMLVIAVVVKVDSPGPALFRQERVGKNGRRFKILKFRSMVCDNDMDDESCEDKCTRVGGVLRRTSLDELPQLLNVIVGQMSFVGPRPWVVDYWTNMTAEERERSRVLPGITGLAQVKGRNGLSIFQKIEYDLIYVRDFSLLQDVKILLMTVKTVVCGDDVDAGKEGVHDDIRVLGER